MAPQERLKITGGCSTHGNARYHARKMVKSARAQTQCRAVKNESTKVSK
jgi:hypothetical protein